VLVDQYDDALSKLRNAHGAYRLFLAGLEIECLMRVKSSLPNDDDRNPRIDAELLFALNSLITAHAGLIMLFPDAANFADELDKYRQQSESLDALRDRVLDPVLWATFGSGKPFCPDYSAVTDDGAAGLLDHGGADLGVLQRPDRSRGGRIHARLCRAPRFEEVVQPRRISSLPSSLREH
jgi:hypothetical protein